MSSGHCVVAVAFSTVHTGLPKHTKSFITLIPKAGVEDDCHAGDTRRQVSLLQIESLEELNDRNNRVDCILPSQLGENITTKGLNLAGLKQGTKLRFNNGNSEQNGAVIEISGLRRAGEKLENRQSGLKERCTVKDPSGTEVSSKVGVFGIVIVGGVVKPGMGIAVEVPGGEEELEPLGFI